LHLGAVQGTGEERTEPYMIIRWRSTAAGNAAMP